ncbi:MAG TPA: 4-vinyl reductase [Longimicrobium sp.]|jgi:bacteriochlorophyll 4-vinyl reductase
MPNDAARGANAGAPSVTPVFPLILLETMRDMDRPEEYLEGEDVALSMPRRLGLSDVIYTQIHRFREEVKRKRLQSAEVVADLIRLVIRRPDCDEIFEEAGRRVARHAWMERSPGFRRMVRFMPPVLAQRSARKAARRLFRQIAAEGALEITARPPGVRIRRSLTARADAGGAACAFYAGALSELMTEYMGRKHAAQHPKCETRGAEACEWVALVVS